MKNKRFLIILMAMLTAFALIGCSEPGSSNTHPNDTVSVSFDPDYAEAQAVRFTIEKNEALGGTRYQQVQTLQTRDGFEFKGWLLNKTGDPLSVSANSTWTADSSYFAKWDAIVADGQSITIKYNVNGFPAAAPNDFTAASGSAIGADALPTLTPDDSKYKFLGWSKTTNGEILDQWAIFRSDTTLYAQWVGLITITYNMNGYPGTQPAPAQVAGNEAIGRAALPNLKQAGYYWLGWSEKPNGTPVTEYAAFVANTTLYARWAVDSGPVTSPPMLTFDMPYDLHPLRASVDPDFIRGADISNCLEIEEHGGVYRNFDGQVQDIMRILTDAGINWVRIRLWIDPTKDSEHYTGDGNNNIGVTKVIAARAKAAGMKFLLNYHYSDYWADPQNRKIPYIWKDIDNRVDLLDALYDYTVETMKELIDAGAAPDMVAIGNEIRNGLLNEHRGGSAGGTGYVLNGWADSTRALARASKAVRDTAPDAKIMVHWDNGGNPSTPDAYAMFTKGKNGAPPQYTPEVDYDVIGISWYTIWPSHGTIDNLYKNIKDFQDRFGKEVVVCETGYMWDIGNWDNMGNYAGPEQEDGAVPALTNAQGFPNDSEIKIATRADGTQYVPSTPENQARVIRATIDAIAAAGGSGIMWWGADWIGVPGNSGVRSNSEMATMFESTGSASTNGKVLPVTRVMGAINGVTTQKPGKITSLQADPDLYSVVVTWNKAHPNIANKYQLERADSANGPWTPCGAEISVTDEAQYNANNKKGSYTSTDLVIDGTYYYHVRAGNDNGWGNWSDPLQVKTLLFVPRGIKITTTIDTATLTWNKLTGANKYEISRAASANGPWTTVDDNVSGTLTTYTDTGVAPNNVYYYRLRGYDTKWGEYSETVTAGTLPIPPAANFRITAADSTSVTLNWNAPAGAITGYEIYSAQSATEPADTAYTLLTTLGTGDTSYSDTEITTGNTYWYKIRVLWSPYGSSVWSRVRYFTVGGDLKAKNINMSTGKLDDDFTYELKASSTTSYGHTGYAGEAPTNHKMIGMYVANDAANLYVALDFGDKQPGGWQRDRIVVWIDNNNSSAGGADINTMKIADEQTVTGTIESCVYIKMEDGAVAGTAGVTANTTFAGGTEDVGWAYSPTTANLTVLKFSIPLANIANAVAGNELKVFAAFSEGWNATKTVWNGVIPSGAVTGSPRVEKITVNMNNALSYTVK